MNCTQVPHQVAISLIGNNAQETVAAAPHPTQQRCRSFAHDRIEVVCTRCRKHRWCATETWKRQQYPESIVVLHTQGIIRLLRISGPQTVSVKCLKNLNRVNLTLLSHVANLRASRYVAFYGYRPALSLHIIIVIAILCDPVTKEFKLFDSVQSRTTKRNWRYYLVGLV